jgi:hypothetical protein
LRALICPSAGDEGGVRNDLRSTDRVAVVATTISVSIARRRNEEQKPPAGAGGFPV